MSSGRPRQCASGGGLNRAPLARYRDERIQRRTIVWLWLSCSPPALIPLFTLMVLARTNVWLGLRLTPPALTFVLIFMGSPAGTGDSGLREVFTARLLGKYARERSPLNARLGHRLVARQPPR